MIRLSSAQVQPDSGLPGFTWFTPASFMLGLAESFIWGVLFGVIFVPIYNYLADKFKKR
ncbi:MAG: DUF5676 family membrane protein [Candidatus Methanoperedens sp.]